jgi:hypothetical protein
MNATSSLVFVCTPLFCPRAPCADARQLAHPRSPRVTGEIHVGRRTPPFLPPSGPLPTYLSDPGHARRARMACSNPDNPFQIGEIPCLDPFAPGGAAIALRSRDRNGSRKGGSS